MCFPSVYISQSDIKVKEITALTYCTIDKSWNSRTLKFWYINNDDL